MPKITLEIDTDLGSIQAKIPNGHAVRNMEIDPLDLFKLIRESVYNVILDRIKSPIFPQEYPVVYYEQQERQSEQPTHIVVLKYPKKIIPYNHDGEIRNLGVPRLLFGYKIANSYVYHYVVAVKDEVIKKSTTVYHYPYTNVDARGGICTGGVVFKKIENPHEDLSELSYFPTAWLFSTHTHENNGTGQPAKPIMDKNENQQFNNDLLVPMCTFEEWITKMAR